MNGKVNGINAIITKVLKDEGTDILSINQNYLTYDNIKLLFFAVIGKIILS